MDPDNAASKKRSVDDVTPSTVPKVKKWKKTKVEDYGRFRYIIMLDLKIYVVS